MKNAPKKFAVVAVALLAGLTACPNNETEPTEPTGPTVAEKYRFTTGFWFIGSNEVSGAVPTLGESTFTVSGGGIDISYTNVYTKGGGIDPKGYPWAYLYAGNVKIGQAKKTGPDLSVTQINLGKTGNSNFDYVEASDMQDTHNGYALALF